MKRREMLRKTGAGLAASTAAMGVAGARADHEPLARERVSAAATSVLAEDDRLVEDLAADDLVDGTDLAVREEEFTTSTVSLGDVETWMAGFSRTVEDGELRVHVLPEFDLAYATLSGDDGTFETYGDGVSPDACDDYCYYEVCYCVDECGRYCCDHECTCVLRCECSGTICP